MLSMKGFKTEINHLLRGAVTMKTQQLAPEKSSCILENLTRTQQSEAQLNNNNVLLDAEHKDISASCSIVRTVV